VQYLFTDRKGGVSAPPFSSLNLGRRVGDDPAAVAENRARLTARLGGARPVFMQQIHSATVRTIGGDGLGEDVAQTDGLVTDRPGIALAVLAADCVPILAFDEEAAVIGVAHAGRLGSAAGIGAELVAAMTGLGADAHRMTLILGPAVCGRCYEVPDAMRDEVDASLPGSATVTRSGSPALDLRAGLAAQLAALGVCDVRTDPRCTMEDPTLFSHRRDARTGRQAGVIWLD